MERKEEKGSRSEMTAVVRVKNRTANSGGAQRGQIRDVLERTRCRRWVEHRKRRVDDRMLHDLGCRNKGGGGGGIYKDKWKKKMGELEGGRTGRGWEKENEGFHTFGQHPIQVIWHLAADHSAYLIDL